MNEIEFLTFMIHCRDVILKKVGFTEPPIPKPPPGPVVGLVVVTPGTPDSGSATATFESPVGFLPGTLDYILTLTGGPGTITIVSIVPQ